MKVRFTVGVLMAALALLLGIASPAMAKHGNGGGGNTAPTFTLPTASQLDRSPCAFITSWTPGVATNTLGPVVVLDIGVQNDCGLDEKSYGSMSLMVTDSATGAFVSSTTIMAGLPTSVYHYTLGTVSGFTSSTVPDRTLTFAAYKANGKLQALRTASLAETVAAALAAQQAA